MGFCMDQISVHPSTVNTLFLLYKVFVLFAQSCPTLCDPMDCSPPGSSVHGILQARILEWVVIPFSRIFPTQGLNPGLPHCRRILYRLSHQGCHQDLRNAAGFRNPISWLLGGRNCMAVGFFVCLFFAAVGAGPDQLASCPHQRQQAVICFLGCIKQVGRQ